MDANWLIFGAAILGVVVTAIVVHKKDQQKPQEPLRGSSRGNLWAVLAESVVRFHRLLRFVFRELDEEVFTISSSRIHVRSVVFKTREGR